MKSVTLGLDWKEELAPGTPVLSRAVSSDRSSNVSLTKAVHTLKGRTQPDRGKSCGIKIFPQQGLNNHSLTCVSVRGLDMMGTRSLC